MQPTCEAPLPASLSCSPFLGAILGSALISSAVVPWRPSPPAFAKPLVNAGEILPLEVKSCCSNLLLYLQSN